MSRSLFSLEGRCALVTGSARGLGLAIARGLAAQGAHVLVNGRDDAAIERAVHSVCEQGGHASACGFDVADAAAVERALDRCEQAGMSVDILVNNVGIRDRRGAFDFEIDDVRHLLDVNLVAPFSLCRQIAHRMITRGTGRGRIVNITSILGSLAGPNDAAYVMAKGGLASMTRALAAEWGVHGITVNGVAPGFFATETNAAVVENAGVTRMLQRRTSLGRWGQPAEIAGAVGFLASDAASYVTGEIIAVDGGYSAHA